MNRCVLTFLLTVLACAGQRAVQQVPQLTDIPDPSSHSCAPLDPTIVGRVDVVIAIDASRSSRDMAGLDINANGRAGKPKLARRAGVFDIEYSDPADSFLAAQIVAARSLVRRSTGSRVRFSVISFYGRPGNSVSAAALGSQPSATIELDLTQSLGSLETALARVFEREPGIGTDFAAAIRAATKALEDSRDPSVRRLVLFMSVSPIPSLPNPDGTVRSDDPSMKDAAAAAVAAGIVFQTFALGPEPLPGSRWASSFNYLKHIGVATGGSYARISQIDRLHCLLADSLAP